MAIVTDQPADLKTTNALDNIPDDDLLGPVPAQLHFSGKTLLVMEKPPVKGEFVKVELTLRCKGDGTDLLDGDELVHYRKMAFVSAKVTAEAYKPNPAEPATDDPAAPAMFDHGGNTNPDAIADEEADEEADELEPDDDETDEDE
jgi:hypothetical protein